MGHQFRLTFHHQRPGVFRFDEQTKVISLADGRELHLVARDADTLAKASRFHLEMHSFADEEAARACGEQLRTCLRVLNAVLNLGLTIPGQDSRMANLTDAMKQKQLEEHGVTLIDSIVGLATFPDDGKHAEMVSAGAMNVYPSDPEYVLAAIRTLWARGTFPFNERQKDALEILGHATAEASPRTRFLLRYLALERMIEVGERSETARFLLQSFIEQAKVGLPAEEAMQLEGALRSLYKRSVASALRALAARIQDPQEIGGRSIADFFAECVRTRNQIAHDASPADAASLAELADELRRVVLSLIWTESGLAPVSFDVPPSKVQMEKFQIRIL